jgi:hypothetical protein
MDFEKGQHTRHNFQIRREKLKPEYMAYKNNFDLENSTMKQMKKI